ncbi:hypothetical protein RHS01_11283 [Rhizoctonia solani]|uniref:Uncharacterized protein n=1 Tax=Rhizoctonia solani TaxID=456999 RepID=A0A8H7I0F3_9AGAM|nr:hypothetical protein RHS01_11283 [Rhizoctonia solani]
MRSILQDQTNPASDDPSPHLSKAVFFPWTRSSIRTLWGGGRATRMPWRGASEDQPPEERWDRVVQSGKTVWPYVLEIKLVHTRGNKLREIMALTIREDERLRTVTWALEFDTLHPLVCVGGDTGIIHVFNVESWEMVGVMTGHGGAENNHLTTHKIRPDYILSFRTTIRLECGPWPIQWMYPPCQFFGPVRKKSRLISMAIGDLARSASFVQPQIQLTLNRWRLARLNDRISSRRCRLSCAPSTGGVPDPEQAGKGKGACIAVFKGAGVYWADTIQVMHADLTSPCRKYSFLTRRVLNPYVMDVILEFWISSVLVDQSRNRVHVVDIQKYNQSPEEVKSRMKDPEIRAARREIEEVRYGNRVELKDVPRAQLYAGNSSQSYSILELCRILIAWYDYRAGKRWVVDAVEGWRTTSVE